MDQQLSERKKQLQRELNKIELKELLAKEKTARPIAKKQFEGKYFKYDNGINHQTRWPMYLFCKKVKTSQIGIFNCFETQVSDYKTEYVFCKDKEAWLDFCQTEITKEEYEQALNKFRKNYL